MIIFNYNEWNINEQNTNYLVEYLDNLFIEFSDYIHENDVMTVDVYNEYFHELTPFLNEFEGITVYDTHIQLNEFFSKKPEWKSKQPKKDVAKKYHNALSKTADDTKTAYNRYLHGRIEQGEFSSTINKNKQIQKKILNKAKKLGISKDLYDVSRES